MDRKLMTRAERELALLYQLQQCDLTDEQTLSMLLKSVFMLIVMGFFVMPLFSPMAGGLLTMVAPMLVLYYCHLYYTQLNWEKKFGDDRTFLESFYVHVIQNQDMMSNK